MILHVYFAKKFLWIIAGLTAVLFALIALADLVDLLQTFSDNDDVGLPQVVRLMMLKAPGSINQILPLILLLSTIVLFLALARSSEMVVTRAAGRSAIRSLLGPVCVTLFIGFIAVTTLGPLVTAFSNQFAKLNESYRTGVDATLSISAEGLWLRQGNEDGQTVIRATQSSPDAGVLFDVTFLSYTPNGAPDKRIEASSAALGEGVWTLRNAKLWTLSDGGNPESSAQTHDTLFVPSNLTQDRIRETLGTSSGVSIWDVQEFLQRLEQAGFSSKRHRVWFQEELSRPLFLMSMVLIGAAFTMRHTRFGGTGGAVISAVMLGFAMYFARSFAVILGENGQLSVPLATWAVPIAANLLALGFILQAEDG